MHTEGLGTILSSTLSLIMEEKMEAGRREVPTGGGWLEPEIRPSSDGQASVALSPVPCPTWASPTTGLALILQADLWTPDASGQQGRVKLSFEPHLPPSLS